MASPSKNSRPRILKTHLLQPSLTSIDESEAVLRRQNLSASSPDSKSKALSSSIFFHGWRFASTNFRSWAKKMSDLHEPTWRKAGIFEAITASTYKIQRNDDLVLALVEKWCPDTKSFVFPWGEATITLEDVKLLLGFSVLGFPYFAPLNSCGEKTKQNLEEECQKIKKDKGFQANEVVWISRFMNSGDELEHVAFLALWLSYFVFPSCHYHISEAIFPIAVHLSRGTRIAIAPAVLAHLYSDLTLLKTHIGAFSGSTIPLKIDLSSLCKLVLVWTWERFRELQPKPYPMVKGEPRLARWHDLIQKTSNAKQILDNSNVDNFEWRPYREALENWNIPQFYPEIATWPNSELKASTSSVNATANHFVRDASGITQSRMERPPFKSDMHTGASQVPDNKVPLQSSSRIISYGPPSESKLPLQNSSRTISFGPPSDSKVPPLYSSRVTDPSSRPFMPQTPPATFQGMKGVNYGQTSSSSFGNSHHHAEIAKIIHKFLQARAKQNLLWNPPSREYMSKEIQCQMCQGTVNEVDTVLICDACEKGYHLKCLQANNLKGVPKSEWHCSRCVQIYNGKPFPPKYGLAMRSATTTKMSSSSSEVQIPAVGKVGSKMNLKVNQKAVPRPETPKPTGDAAAKDQADDGNNESQGLTGNDAAMNQAADGNNESQGTIGNDTAMDEADNESQGPIAAMDESDDANKESSPMVVSQTDESNNHVNVGITIGDENQRRDRLLHESGLGTRLQLSDSYTKSLNEVKAKIAKIQEHIDNAQRDLAWMNERYTRVI